MRGWGGGEAVCVCGVDQDIEGVCVHACACACARVCVRARVYACARAYACASSRPYPKARPRVGEEGHGGRGQALRRHLPREKLRQRGPLRGPQPVVPRHRHDPRPARQRRVVVPQEAPRPAPQAQPLRDQGHVLLPRRDDDGRRGRQAQGGLDRVPRGEEAAEGKVEVERLLVRGGSGMVGG